MIVNQDHHIKAAVIFGEGRLNIGIVIEPLPEHAFDPSDKSKIVDFYAKVIDHHHILGFCYDLTNFARCSRIDA